MNSPLLESAATGDTGVYAVHGAEPEVLAYAMAKYSRSSLSMKESLREISSQKAEQFLNTFYFQYGHRSIADLAHLAFAIEKLSLLAAIELVDEQRWDGQERSTRYQNFKKSGWHTPGFGGDVATQAEFTQEVEALFAAYDKIFAGTFEFLKTKIAKPDAMAQDAFERTVKARAFDVARYLLPLATNTSLGQIVNARTLETQISRLLSSEFAEVRMLGEKLKAAAAGTAWNPDPSAREVHVAPTLVKYAAASPYEMESRRALAQAARELLGNQNIASAPLVDLVEPEAGISPNDALEIDLAASLLYPHCHFSFRQIRDAVLALTAARRGELVALGVQHRGRHDELPRAYSAGQALRFDILMDIGGFRDMHRHRRCVQLRQPYTITHGYEIPQYVDESGLLPEYRAAMDRAFAIAHQLSPCHSDRSAQRAVEYPASTGCHSERAQRVEEPAFAFDSLYLLPLGTRCRSLFKMDFAEAVYISDLRSQPQGHFSYRRVAWEMYQAVSRHYPALAALFHVTDIHAPVDLLKR
jgi:thymidylate synthase ThyX